MSPTSNHAEICRHVKYGLSGSGAPRMCSTRPQSVYRTFAFQRRSNWRKSGRRLAHHRRPGKSASFLTSLCGAFCPQVKWRCAGKKRKVKRGRTHTQCRSSSRLCGQWLRGPLPVCRVVPSPEMLSNHNRCLVVQHEILDNR